MEFILRYSEPEGEANPYTIARHNEVIRGSAGKGVWWGWWRKWAGTSGWGEDFQKRSWDELDERIRANGAVEVFIVNNQGPFFYIATCDGMKRGGGRRIMAPDYRLVPKYYRDDRFPVWLHFAKLAKSNRQTYGRRCGAVLPYRHATFFTARPQGRSISIRPLPHWNSRPLKVEGNAILHLSDLHIVPGQQIPPHSDMPGTASLLDRIDQAREIVKVDVGLVVISGDLVNGVRVDGLAEVESKFKPSFDTAEAFLRSLCRKLGIGPRSVLIVPGNHDLPILAGKELSDAKKSYLHYGAYNAFINRFYDLPAANFGAVQYCERPQVVKFPAGSVGFGLFDSCRLRDTGREHLGYVANHQALPILQWLSDWQTDLKTDGDALSGVIGVVHHHLTPVLPVENPGPADEQSRQRQLSVMIDAAQFAETLSRFRVSQVWHGHGHVPCIRRLASDRQDRDAVGGKTDLYGVDIIGLGTSGSSRFSDVFPYQSLAIHTVSEAGIENRLFRFNAQSDLVSYRSNYRQWDGLQWGE